jgi:hypothetical protein
MPPEHALISTFQTYKPKKGDPRLGIVAKGASPTFWTAVCGRENEFYFNVQEFNAGGSRINYLALTNCGEIQTAQIDRNTTIDTLAEEAFAKIFGEDPHAIATAVMLWDGGIEFVSKVYQPKKGK